MDPQSYYYHHVEPHLVAGSARQRYPLLRWAIPIGLFIICKLLWPHLFV